jgi:peptide deformylase
MTKAPGTILSIRIYGDKVLRQKAEKVVDITPEIRNFITDLIETMYVKDGIGLAAPQVGKSISIFIVDPFWYKEGYEKNPYVFINPKFLEFEGIETSDEGCLSLPNIYENVPRAKKITVEYENENGEKKTINAEGMFARAIQHEFDHLDGILFVDKISKYRRIILKRKLHELEKSTNAVGENFRKDA